jgi:hypothetical protein
VRLSSGSIEWTYSQTKRFYIPEVSVYSSDISNFKAGKQIVLTCRNSQRPDSVGYHHLLLRSYRLDLYIRFLLVYAFLRSTSSRTFYSCHIYYILMVRGAELLCCHGVDIPAPPPSVISPSSLHIKLNVQPEYFFCCTGI